MIRVVLVALLASVALAGCFNDFDDGRRSHVGVVSMDVSAPKVLSGVVTLAVHTTLDNSGDRSGEVRLVVKAFDGATGLLVATGSNSVGRIGAQQTEAVEVRLDLPRASAYRIEVLVHEDGHLATRGSVQVSNVAALEPNVHATGLRIAEMEFLVDDVTEDRAAIQTDVYVTNEGEGLSAPLRIHLKAREVSTGLLADDEWTDVPAVAPEQTRIVSVTLDVPRGHNYEVHGVLWDEDFIVGRGQGDVQLLPNFTKPKDQELVVTEPDLRHFRQGGVGFIGDQDPAAGRGGSYVDQATPGAPWALLAMAVLATAFFARRRSA